MGGIRNGAATEVRPDLGRLRWIPVVADVVGWLAHVFGEALEREIAQRRLFLWLPAAAGAGVILYFSADREPSLYYAALLTAIAAAGAFWLRRFRTARSVLLALAGLMAGFTAATLRTALLSAPIIKHIAVLRLSGTVEQVDPRRVGARFVLRVASAEGLRPDETPYRVRLTTRELPNFQAGTLSG